MARADAMSVLYAKNKSALEFQWDSLFGPSVYQLIPPADVERLRQIATSIKLNGNIVEKKKLINEIMVKNGFMRFHAGTNRVVYTHYELPDIVCKVAVDRVGMNDNPSEFRNQYYLKPFVTKCFDISPCGTVGIFERVQPINSIEEFAYIYEDTFDLITKVLIGKYVLEDIGSKFYNNYGIRVGFGVCLLDYPYMYKLDATKLVCNRPIFPNTKEPVCGGEIDYDNGFNYLICRCCGKRYSAKDLEDKRKEGLIKIKGGTNMLDVVVTVNGKETRPKRVSTTIQKPAPKAKEQKRSGKLDVVLTVGGKKMENAPVSNNTNNDNTMPGRDSKGRFVSNRAAKNVSSPKRKVTIHADAEEPLNENLTEPEVEPAVSSELPNENNQEEIIPTESVQNKKSLDESNQKEPVETKAPSKDKKNYDKYNEYYEKTVSGNRKKASKNANGGTEKIQRRRASLEDY